MPIHLPPISRRQFLAGALATGAGLLLPERLWAAEGADTNRWTFMADTHISQHRDRIFSGVKPADNFEEGRRQVLALAPKTSGVIIAGDCACTKGEKADYAVLVDLVKPYREAAVPVHMALGNHDYRENFYEVFPGAKSSRPLGDLDRHVSIIQTPHANFFLLDSLLDTNLVPGGLGDAQLQWLATALDTHADRPAVLFAHHNPEQIRDFDAFRNVMAPRKHVKAYVYGHSHRWRLSEIDGIHLVNLPAMAWLFDETLPRGWVDAQLHPNGMTLVLNTLEKKHKLHGQTTKLAWRV